jgi:hypothetical protein
MRSEFQAPWHKQSYDRFLQDGLPALLAERLPLAGYSAEPAGPHACRVRVVVGGDGKQVSLTIEDVPAPDEQGVFLIDGVHRLVLPVASCERLDEAEVRCVGDRLLEYVAGRLGKAPADLQWDEPLLRSWLPLGEWVREFMAEQARGMAATNWLSRASQRLDDTNWLSRVTHLRRVFIPDRRDVIAPGQQGRVCPFETPEGTNIGRILTIARGARIENGRLRIVEESPVAALGVTASMIPLLEHDDANRLLMGVNMMRQWLVPPDPEPALVQSGNEPTDVPDFWCGRNLLTAFISWGPGTFEDGILLSESAAKRMDFYRPLDVGDKLSNRHGTKGTVSRIVPDAQMPHLADGTAVELVFNFIGCHTRLNFGQVREAVLGRIAHAQGAPIIVPPFEAPDDRTLRAKMKAAGLPASGVEVLTDGRDGPPLEGPSTVGWVYWGKTHHLSREKLHFSLDGPHAQWQRELEYAALRDVGAFATIAEHFNTRAAERDGAAELAMRVASGLVEPAGPPTPRFRELARRLDAAGIAAKLSGDRLTFGLADPAGPTLQLARPIVHPWRIGRPLAAVGVREDFPQYDALVEANTAAERMLSGDAPESLAHRALGQLSAALQAYLDALLTPDDLRPSARTVFSARTVISPGLDLSLDQVGVADELAWALFGPLVTRELGDAEAVAGRTDKAAAVLDKLLATSWILCNRAPTIMPTSFLAFHPVRVPEPVFRLHPLACRLMNADYDGDQMAVFLPLTEAAQREAGERLSILGHLRRDPGVVRWLCPPQDMLWGLARLSLTAEGRDEIASLAGVEVAAPAGHLTADSLADAMQRLLERDGAEAVLGAVQRLMKRGLEVTHRSGASISPFVGSDLERPDPPAEDSCGAWQAYREAVMQRAVSSTDFEGTDFGPQVLAVRSGARGSIQQLVVLLGPRGVVTDVQGNPNVIIRHGLQEGMTPAETFACVPGARRGLGRTVLECARIGYGIRESAVPRGFNVLARAMRAERPGVVFAQAAEMGGTDPLTDLDSRLFVGLPPL